MAPCVAAPTPDEMCHRKDNGQPHQGRVPRLPAKDLEPWKDVLGQGIAKRLQASDRHRSLGVERLEGYSLLCHLKFPLSTQQRILGKLSPAGLL